MDMKPSVWPILSRIVAALVAVALLGLSACKREAPKLDTATVQIVIRTILEQQNRDWNEGKIDKFMRGYAQSESTRFASGGNVSRGWQAVLDRYRQKYPNQAAMGKLTFSEIDITVLSSDAALAFGHWRLEQTTNAPSGLFTLLFRNTQDGWRIVHDHTSEANPMAEIRKPK